MRNREMFFTKIAALRDIVAEMGAEIGLLGMKTDAASEFVAKRVALAAAETGVGPSGAADALKARYDSITKASAACRERLSDAIDRLRGCAPAPKAGSRPWFHRLFGFAFDVGALAGRPLQLACFAPCIVWSRSRFQRAEGIEGEKESIRKAAIDDLLAVLKHEINRGAEAANRTKSKVRVQP